MLVRLTLRTEMSVSRGEDMSRAPIHSIELEAQRKELDLAMLRARSAAAGPWNWARERRPSPIKPAVHHNDGLILEMESSCCCCLLGTLCCSCHTYRSRDTHRATKFVPQRSGWQSVVFPLSLVFARMIAFTKRTLD